MGDEVEFEVSVEVGEDRVVVVAGDGATQSRATIERSADAEVLSYIPIGTRDAGQLSMTLDGATVAVRPGPGRYTRGSYRVVAVHNGVNYLLEATSEVSSRLSRDGVRLGELSRLSNADIHVTWKHGAEVGVVDAALGYALAAAFGTGAKHFLMMLFEGVAPSTPV
jgi:hypothetical protein